MPIISRLTCAIVAGVCITTALPVLAAIGLARLQAVESQERLALDLARSALKRAELSGTQLWAAAREVNALSSEEACSPNGLDLMRKLDLSSTLLQGVGWVEGNTMRCSSFGGNRPFDLGEPSFVSSTGSKFWTNVELIAPDQPFVAVQTGSSVGIIHKDLALSFVESVPGLNVSVFSWSHREPIIERGGAVQNIWKANWSEIQYSAAGITQSLSSDLMVKT